MTRATIIDYAVGNVRSLGLALEQLGAQVRCSDKPDDVRWAERILLPGVGAFGAARKRLAEPELAAALEEARQAGKPILGICLGLQLLTRHSEEGNEPGLGWLPGETRRLDAFGGFRHRIPHLGWAALRVESLDPLLAQPLGGSQFYFAHSFVLDGAAPEDVLATAWYGREFPAVVRRGNLLGVQFHPERSQQAGREFLKRYLDGSGAA